MLCNRVLLIFKQNFQNCQHALNVHMTKCLLTELDRAGRARKQTKESAAKQLCVVIQLYFNAHGLHWVRRFVDIGVARRVCRHSCYCCRVKRFFYNTEHFFTLCQLAIDTGAIDLSARQTSVSFLINVFSFLLSCFRFFELVYIFFFLMWPMFTYKLIELHLIPKRLVTQNKNANQRSSQLVTSRRLTLETHRRAAKSKAIRWEGVWWGVGKNLLVSRPQSSISRSRRGVGRAWLNSSDARGYAACTSIARLFSNVSLAPRLDIP